MRGDQEKDHGPKTSLALWDAENVYSTQLVLSDDPPKVPQVDKNCPPKAKACQRAPRGSIRGKPPHGRRNWTKRQAEVTEIQTEEEEDYDEPEGGSDEEVAEVQGSEEEDQGQDDHEQGNA